jgi:hypothetical protein
MLGLGLGMLAGAWLALRLPALPHWLCIAALALGVAILCRGRPTTAGLALGFALAGVVAEPCAC